MFFSYDTEQRRKLAEDFPEFLTHAVRGQPLAVQKVAGTLSQRLLLRAKAAERPACCYLFVGTTGTGKTLTCKRIAQHFFGGQLIDVDMGNYGSSETSGLFLGTSRNRSVLAERVANLPCPQQGYVLLLDEIEKAHQEVRTALLALLDKPNFTTNHGNERIDLVNVVVVCTSNIGAADSAGAGEGFQHSIGAAMVNAARGAFSPETCERFDEVVPYTPLPVDALKEIVELRLSEMFKHEYRQGFSSDSISLSGYSVDPVVSAVLGARLSAPELGSRAVRRLITDLIGTPVMRLLLEASRTDSLPAGSFHLRIFMQNPMTDTVGVELLPDEPGAFDRMAGLVATKHGAYCRLKTRSALTLPDFLR